MLFILVGVMNLIHILSCLIGIEVRWPYSCVFVKKKKISLACIWTFADNLFQLRWWKQQSLAFLYQFGWPWPFQFDKSKTSALIFLQISQSIWVKFSMLPQSVGLLKLMLNTFHVISIQGRELYLHDCVKYIFNIGLCSDSFEPISFTLSMMIDTTKLCILIPT